MTIQSELTYLTRFFVTFGGGYPVLESTTFLRRSA